MPSHTTSDQHESQGGVPTTPLPGMDGGSNEEEREDEILDEAIVGDYRPDIFLINLPHSGVVPTEYLWCGFHGDEEVCLVRSPQQ